MSVFTGFTGRIICVGDSITVGGGTTSYPTMLATDLSLTVNSAATGGVGWDHDSSGNVGTSGTLINLAAAQVDTPYVGLNPQPFLVLFAGTNDMAYVPSYTGAQTYAAFQTYLSNRLSAGWARSKIIVCTCLSRSSISDTERQLYNTALVGGVSSDGYLVTRFDLDSRIGFTNSWSDTTYFQDGTHPTTAGNSVIAGIIESLNYPVLAHGQIRWLNR